MPVILRIAKLLAVVLMVPSSSLAQGSLGQFKGDVVAKFLRDGRNMQLEQPYGYIDPRGQHWDVPAGAETDGASIPRVLWISHPPFTGKYRAAAVIHDHYCQMKSRSWKETHEVFYHAMRAAGVEDLTAKVMYAAVYHFGPRWGQGEARTAGAGHDLPLDEETRVFNELKTWIETDSPELGEIARRLDGGTLRGNERRVALVIGNSAYKHTSKLENPRNDAADMAAALEKLGFMVTKGTDLDKAGMDGTVRQFAQTLGRADVGVFFYAGHGLQVAGQNYLVPVDAKLEDASGLDFELVRLDLIQRTMERETQTNILFLDACRDNPLARNLARSMGTRSASIGRGLAAAESGIGTLISYSTQPGNVALDGAGRNSPFAGALLKQLLTSRNDIADVLINVRRGVMQATANKQVPWEHSALTARFHFTPGAAGDAHQAAPSYEQQAELAFWTSVRDSKQPGVVRSYLDKYPNGSFALLAKAIISELETPSLPGTATGPPGPYDGLWQVEITATQPCPFKTRTFPLRIESNVIQGTLIHPGRVDANGGFTFKSQGAVNRGVVVEYAGKFLREAGKGTFKTVGHTCAGTAVLTRFDAPGSAGEPAKVAALPTQEGLRSLGPFDGTWTIVRSGKNCQQNTFNLEIDVIQGSVQGKGPYGSIEGKVSASGALSFNHKRTGGSDMRYSGSLKGNSGTGTFVAVGGACHGTITAKRQ